MSKTLVKRLYSKLKTNKDSYNFIRNLSNNYDLYLFGGGVRDFLNNNLEYCRDLDFVIKARNNCEVNIENFIPNYIKRKKNRFNGYKIYFENCVIDIWNLENTWAFKNNKLDASIENLLNSVYLNIDSLLYSMNDNIYINNCDKAFKQITQLDVLFNETPCENLNLLRAIVYKKKYSLEFSNRLKKILNDYINNNKDALDEFMHLQAEHYNCHILNKQELENELKFLNL